MSTYKVGWFFGRWEFRSNSDCDGNEEVGFTITWHPTYPKDYDAKKKAAADEFYREWQGSDYDEAKRPKEPFKFPYPIKSRGFLLCVQWPTFYRTRV